MNIKAIFLGVAGALFTLPVAAQATGTFEDHKYLFNTIRSHGVTILLNDPKHCDGRVDGSYISSHRILNVCQDNARPGGPETTWTANDLDTLRHEAHHMVQDCAGAGLGNGYIVHLFQDSQQQREFINSVYTPSRQRQLMGSDSYEGHNRYNQLIELEAFATAASVDAQTIAGKLNELCR